MIESEVRALVAERAGSNSSLKVGLLSNPGSGRNKRGLETVRGILKAYPDTLHREARTPDEVSDVLSEFAGNDVDLVALNSGDGTVQAALTALFNNRPFSRLPILGLLRGGSTNVNIGDIGIRGDRDRGLRRLLNWARDLHTGAALCQRPVLRVNASPGSEPIYGMLFGAGVITRGIEYYHNSVHDKGMYDGTATGLTTLRMLLAIARRDPAYVAPISVEVEMDTAEAGSHLPAHDRDYLLLLVSALERLFLGIHPFWGSGSGSLHYTAVHKGPAHTMLAMPPLFWGRPNRFGTPENGYESHRINRLRFSMEGHFTLDGELYRADRSDGPVSVSRDGPVTFVRL